MRISFFTILLSLSFLSILFSCQKDNEKEISDGNSLSEIDKQTFLNLLNEVRTTGCNCTSGEMPPVSPVGWDLRLEKAAKEHCLDMYKNNFFSHISSDGSTLGQRIEKAGFHFSICSENIALGAQSEKQVIELWLSSTKGHCENMVDGRFKYVGAARFGSYWTLDFASE